MITLTFIEVGGIIYTAIFTVVFGLFSLDEYRSRHNRYHTAFIGAFCWPVFLIQRLIYHTTGRVIFERYTRKILGINTRESQMEQ